LPVALTAWLSQDCAMAALMGKKTIKVARAKAARAEAARVMCFIVTSLSCAHGPMHLNMRQMYLQGIASARFLVPTQRGRCGSRMATDRLALGATVRQNIGMTEDEGDKTQ
jgi:hypothetical protein